MTLFIRPLVLIHPNKRELSKKHRHILDVAKRELPKKHRHVLDVARTLMIHMSVLKYL